MDLLRVLAVLFVTCIGTTNLEAAPEDRKAGVDAFVTDMVTKYSLEHDSLMRLMYQAKFRKDIIKAMERPAEAKPWYKYREIFITPDRINGGVKFWRANEEILTNVYQEYGVPPEMIIAILGVETIYGKNMGSYRVIDALSTLAFGYPKRASFFRTELEKFLLLDQKKVLDALTSTGSYAGAIGMPQFMPSSYSDYAIDQDNDGKINLWNDRADIIASVANYFRKHNWHKGEPITRMVTARDVTYDPKELLDRGTDPNIPMIELEAKGITTTPPLTKGVSDIGSTKVSLIRLEGELDDEYWVGFNNFYVITRYNHSNLYAMAAYQLSQRILAQHNSAGVSSVITAP